MWRGKRQFEYASDPLLPELAAYGLEDFVTMLRLDGGRDRVAKALVSMANLAGLSILDLEKVSQIIPVIAKVNWDEVAPRFHLDTSGGVLRLRGFTVPQVFLPPSFHKEVMRHSIQWLDVYQEVVAIGGGSDARVRLMDAWHVPLCALFKGRVIDRPEYFMLDKLEFSGGTIQHEVHMPEGIILIVMELRLLSENAHDRFAPVILELVSAYRRNKDKGLKNLPPVYALATDMTDFHFIRYDGSEFGYHHNQFSVSVVTRPAFLDAVRNVTDLLFSIILEGYISFLKVSQESQPPFGDRPCALSYAISAQEALANVDFTSFDSWEKTAANGLSLLDSSVSQLDKCASSTEWSKEELDVEIDKILDSRLKVPSKGLPAAKSTQTTPATGSE